MGNSQSDIVDLDTKLKSAIEQNEIIKKTFNNNQHELRGTINIDSALVSIEKLIKTHIGNSANILEVGCGNGYNSRKIADLNCINQLLSSDIQKHEPSYYENIQISPAINFIRENWTDNKCNMLLLISPTPDHILLDYGSVKELEKIYKNNKNSNKNKIFLNM